MAEGRFRTWRIDRKIPIPVWIAVGGIGIIAILLGEAMLIDAEARYEGPLVQYAHDHREVDSDAQFNALPPVAAPSQWAYSEGTFGNRSLTVGLVLGAVVAIVRLAKVRLRWLGLRSLAALLVAVSSGFTLLYGARHLFDFSYVDSTLCVQGCYYIPQPIGGWLGTVAIAVVASGLLCVVLGGVATARWLRRIRWKTAEVR